MSDVVKSEVLELQVYDETASAAASYDSPAATHLVHFDVDANAPGGYSHRIWFHHCY